MVIFNCSCDGTFCCRVSVCRYHFYVFVSRQPKISCLEVYENFFINFFMVIVHLLDLKMIFLKWVFFNLRIWLIFKETHWRDLHHFHSVLIDFITTSEKKDIRWLFRFRNPKPKTTNHLPGQHTVQANIQYNQTFKRFKLFERLSFYSMILQRSWKT